MSANIPSTMLLSDLLKATGYDCPAELQGKTFDEATTSPSETQTKSVTITENGATSVTPDAGKLLSKVDITTNVTVPKVATPTISIDTETGKLGIACTTVDAIILYAKNDDGLAVYSTPLTVEAGDTFVALAVKTAMLPSDETEEFVVPSGE